jgi:hypothetical protein
LPDEATYVVHHLGGEAQPFSRRLETILLKRFLVYDAANDPLVENAYAVPTSAPSVAFHNLDERHVPVYSLHVFCPPAGIVDAEDRASSLNEPFPQLKDIPIKVKSWDWSANRSKAE